MRVSKWAFVGLLPLLMTIGCQQARFVQRDANGGIVAVSSDRERMRAMKLIEKEYGKDFVIESEGEVITGQSTVNNVDEKRQTEMKFDFAHPFRTPEEQRKTQTTTTTTDLKEWQIRFHRWIPPKADELIARSEANKTTQLTGATSATGTLQPAGAKIIPANAVQPAQYLAGPKQGVVCTDGCQECKVP